MYHYILGAALLLVAYEAVARFAEYNRKQPSGDESRLHRIRQAQQQGQLPHEIHY